MFSRTGERLRGFRRAQRRGPTRRPGKRRKSACTGPARPSNSVDGFVVRHLKVIHSAWRPRANSLSSEQVGIHLPSQRQMILTTLGPQPFKSSTQTRRASPRSCVRIQLRSSCCSPDNLDVRNNAETGRRLSPAHEALVDALSWLADQAYGTRKTVPECGEERDELLEREGAGLASWLGRKDGTLESRSDSRAQGGGGVGETRGARDRRGRLAGSAQAQKRNGAGLGARSSAEGEDRRVLALGGETASLRSRGRRAAPKSRTQRGSADTVAALLRRYTAEHAKDLLLIGTPFPSAPLNEERQALPTRC